MLKDLRFSLIGMLAAVACCSCDMASTVRYSVAVGQNGFIDNRQVVQMDRKEQFARVYEIASGVASKYGLEKCEGAKCATWNLSCDKVKGILCEEFAAPGGNVNGFSAPGMLIYTQDETHVTVLIRYFVGPTEAFKGMGLELRDRIRNQTGMSVAVDLQ